MTHPDDIARLAHEAMRRAGFVPDFPAEVLAAADQARDVASSLVGAKHVRDLRALPWSSIDNPESRDLDQVEVAESLPGGDIRVLVGIADVDALVPAGGVIDGHARHNTTSVYCGLVVFPMLPERLSTGLTSLNEGCDRAAIVTEFTVRPDGTFHTVDAYRAVLHNRAQLDYPSVGEWLEGRATAPAKVTANAVLEQQLHLQDEAARRLRARRHAEGALEMESIESTPVVRDGQVADLQVRARNRATQLIENFMIASNTAMAEFLEAHGSSTIRRVVRQPERWDRIVQVAATHGTTLPDTPDSAALGAFLSAQRAADPDHFPDLSLSIVKLMGPGEYALETPGTDSGGHFGLAVREYAHSTAPNRRYVDLVTQRLLKALAAGAPAPYSDDALAEIAAHCTAMESASRKVERTCRKQLAALAMAHREGQEFDAIVTGANDKGTFVRTLRPPSEGMVVTGAAGMDVGDRVRVRLVGADAERGFIDFARA